MAPLTPATCVIAGVDPPQALWELGKCDSLLTPADPRYGTVAGVATALGHSGLGVDAPPRIGLDSAPGVAPLGRSGALLGLGSEWAIWTHSGGATASESSIRVRSRRRRTRGRRRRRGRRGTATRTDRRLASHSSPNWSHERDGRSPDVSTSPCGTAEGDGGDGGDGFSQTPPGIESTGLLQNRVTVVTSVTPPLVPTARSSPRRRCRPFGAGSASRRDRGGILWILCRL